MDNPVAEVKWVTEQGEPLDSAVPTPDVAAYVLKQLEDADAAASRRRAHIKAMADNAPPYDQAELDQKNLGFLTNISFREMAAMLDQKASQAAELLQDVPQLVTITLRGLDEDPDGMDVQPRTTWEDVIAAEFTTMLQDWAGWTPCMDFVRRQADLYGVGMLMWRDPWDWRPVRVSRGALFPSPYASVVLDEWPTTGISDTMTVHELLAIINGENESLRDGWKPEAIKKYLASIYVEGSQAGPSGTDGTPSGTPTVSPWERYQERIKLNEPSVVARMFEPVHLRHLYIKEPKSGRISHYILPGDLNTQFGWLYARKDEFEKFSEQAWILPYNFGDGYLKTVRSLADMTADFFDISNRFLGRILDAGFTRGSLILQAVDKSTDPRRIQMGRSGLVTILPAGVNVIQASSFTPPLQEMSVVRDLVVSTMKNNTGQWKQNVEAIHQRDLSAREVAENVTKEAKLEQSNIAADYVMYDQLYRELMRRALKTGAIDKPDLTLPGAKEAAEFVQRCVARGVPREYLVFSKLEIHAFRAIGAGSYGVRLDIAKTVFQMREVFDEHGKTNAVRDFLTVLVGPRHVNRYRAPNSRDPIPSNSTSHATLENNDLQQGQMTQVGSDQQHVLHILTHASLLQRYVAAVQESGGRLPNAEQILTGLEAVLVHIQEHAQQIAGDPAQAAFLNELGPLLQAAIQVKKVLESIVKAMIEAREKASAEQQKLLDEAQGIVVNHEREMERMKTAAKIQDEHYKGASLIQMRADRQRAGEEINRRRTEADLALKAERQAVELDLKRQLASVEAELKRVKANTGGTR